jgi:hypothetical protein
MGEPKGKWTLETALEALSRNKYRIEQGEIQAYGAGLHLLGAIDFLVGKHGYSRMLGEKKNGSWKH